MRNPLPKLKTTPTILGFIIALIVSAIEIYCFNYYQLFNNLELKHYIVLTIIQLGFTLIFTIACSYALDNDTEFKHVLITNIAAICLLFINFIILI